MQTKIAQSCRMVSLVLFVMLIGGQTLNAGPRPRKAELETSVEANRSLALLGAQDFSQVKDSRMRAAARRALSALKAIAGNTSKTREAELISKLDRSIMALKALPQPRTMSLQMCDERYKTCVELCKLNNSNCALCGISQNGCYLNQLAIALAQEHDPSKG